MALPAQPRPPKDRAFQTKNTTPQLLERFTITAAGRLIHHTVRYQEVPHNDRPYPYTPWVGSMRAVPHDDVDTNFHGMLQFYAYENATREWWCYEAKFTDGQCVEITCIEYDRGAG
jgi:hypothetical protein